MKAMKPDEFLALPAAEISALLRVGGPQVCVFPFNGTRRWFMLEHGHHNYPNPAQAYTDLASKRYVEMYKMLFDHGLDTVVAPVFGGDIYNRGEEYMEQIGTGLAFLARNRTFLAFYEHYDVRVHFYGDYRRALAGTPYMYLADLFDEIIRKTAHNRSYRLFYGIFGNDATEAIARLSIDYYRQTGQTPTRRQLIELYYGEYLEKANIFIGFEKFSVFDYPLLGLGEENLYFTVAPSLYMSERQLRSILYDHLYQRPVQEPDYASMAVHDIEVMRRFYDTNRDATFGLGIAHGGIWYPAGKRLNNQPVEAFGDQ